MTRLPAIVWARRTFCAHRWRCACLWAVGIFGLVAALGDVVGLPTSGGAVLRWLFGAVQ